MAITVTAVDDPPTAVADAATVLEDSAATVLDVLANDTNSDGGPRSVTAVTQPANAKLNNSGKRSTLRGSSRADA